MLHTFHTRTYKHTFTHIPASTLLTSLSSASESMKSAIALWGKLAPASTSFIQTRYYRRLAQVPLPESHTKEEESLPASPLAAPQKKNLSLASYWYYWHNAKTRPARNGVLRCSRLHGSPGQREQLTPEGSRTATTRKPAARKLATTKSMPTPMMHQVPRSARGTGRRCECCLYSPPNTATAS